MWVTLVVGLGIAGGLVYLATLGYIYISAGLMLAVIGSIGYAIQKASALRGHLRDLDRRYVPLPAATAQSPGAKREP